MYTNNLRNWIYKDETNYVINKDLTILNIFCNPRVNHLYTTVKYDSDSNPTAIIVKRIKAKCYGKYSFSNLKYSNHVSTFKANVIGIKVKLFVDNVDNN